MADKIPRRLRFEILRRDKHTCRYCGAMAPDVVLTIDHVMPTALGGSDDASNLVTACAACNGGKASIAPDSPIVGDVERDALRWANAIQLAAEYRAAEQQALYDVIYGFQSKWATWGVGEGDDRQRVPMDPNWEDTLERFINLGLTEDDLERLMLVAMHHTRLAMADRWRYFCGCCWRAVTELQETARQIIEQDEWEANR